MLIGDFKGTASLGLILHFLLHLHGLSHFFFLILLVELIIFFIVHIFLFENRRWMRPTGLWLIDLCDQLFYLL